MLTRLYIVFSDAQGQLTQVSGGILPKFELIQAFVVVLVTCKNEEDLIKNEGARVLTSLLYDFSDAQGQLTQIVSGGIPPKLELIQAFIVVLVTYKNEEDSIQNEGARVLTSLLFDFSDAQGQLTPKSAVEFRRNSNSSKLL